MENKGSALVEEEGRGGLMNYSDTCNYVLDIIRISHTKQIVDSMLVPPSLGSSRTQSMPSFIRSKAFRTLHHPIQDTTLILP